ncbi:MAG: FtsX-like permease family protein [Blautia sp.]|nr:FtsX-like permease family protein [Blautia sp.]
MKKRAIRKDFYVEIRKSLGRFLSIFFIVAMGVAFFSGIRAGEPDMRYSGDAYFDRNNVMDLRVIGTLGLTEKDIEALKETEGVETVEPGYSADMLLNVEGNYKVLHVASVLKDMNKYTVEEGRMPEKSGECLMDGDFLKAHGFQIGDKITLSSGTKDAVTDTLKTDTFEIVGSGSSSMYFTYARGSSTVGNGEVSGFIGVLPEDFGLEAYTECYVSVKDAKALTAFTSQYDAKVEKVQENIEEIADEQGKRRVDEIREEAEAELADAQAELDKGKKEAEEKLTDAKKQIDDGEKQLQEGKEQLKKANDELQSGKNKLYASQKEVDAAKKEISNGWSQYNTAKKEFDAQEAAFKEQYDAGMAEISKGEEELKKAWDAFYSQKAEYDSGVTALTQAKELLAKLLASLESGMLPPEQIPQIQAQADALKAEIAEKEPVLQASGQQIAAAQATLEQKQQEADTQFAEAKKQLEQGQAAIEAGRQQLEASRQKLVAGEEQAKKGQKQIDAGWSKIHDGEKQKTESETLVAENEEKLAKAKEEYEQGKAEAEQEIHDGEEKIKDAQLEINKIENAQWYVQDRSALPEYTGFGDNADRIRAIAKVFPILFFIVAALISLTTMTRMVEEQRTQIGTLKALGYGKLSIAGKYLNYALLATVGGSIFGVLFGEKVFPYIIVTAYKIMYTHVPDVVIPYNWEYGIMAAGAAILCTGLATLLACYKELASQPAVLMRPPAPKQGKRVFLERIPFIWKHLSFIWKSTIRNLIRYKKRFFMTVFGIGGCMALMIVGFGLRDSIFAIGKLQYGELQLYDGMVILNTDAEEEDRKEPAKYLSSEKEVSDIMEGYSKRVTISKGKEEQEVYLSVPSDLEKNKEFQVFRNRITKKEFELEKNSVILTEKAAQLLDVEKGDKIVLEDKDEKQAELQVTDICENYMEHYLYIPPETYREIYGEDMEPNTVYFKMKNFNEKGVKEIGENILDKRGALNVTYTYNIQGQLDDMLESLDIVIVVLIISAGLLAFVVLYNLNNINITERKRELATIKVLGFYDKEVSAYVLRENILLTIIGVVVGIALGSILHRFVIVTVEIDSVMFTRIIENISFVLSAALTCMFSFLVNAVMYFKLKKIDMVESLKSVE